MAKPMKITTIIPTLNAEQYIDRCIRSIVEQNYEDFEVIVIDAGSEDATMDIALACHPNVRFITETGCSQGRARNIGINESNGGIITFLDSDDRYITGYFRELNDFYSQFDSDVRYSPVYHFRTGAPKVYGIKKYGLQPKDVYDFLSGLGHNLAGMSGRRSVFIENKFQEGKDGKVGEEGFLQTCIALRGYKYTYVDKPLAVVELRPDSHTQWAIQKTMKRKRIADLEMFLEFSKSEYSSSINMEIKRAAKKAFFAEYLVKDPIVSDVISRMKFVDRMVYTLLSFLLNSVPFGIRSRLIERFWLLKQDSTFTWAIYSND